MAVFLTGGCFSVTAQAPYGPDVKVLSADEPVEISRTFQKWYLLYGILPLSTSDTPKRVIDDEELVEVRVIIEDTLGDLITGAVVTLLSVGIVSTTTFTVEGNRTGN